MKTQHALPVLASVVNLMDLKVAKIKIFNHHRREYLQNEAHFWYFLRFLFCRQAKLTAKAMIKNGVFSPLNEPNS
ncbi:hypothetical protein [Rheinheimera gaetbuli]